jgi:hexulose-6-phosphate isomerase
VLPSLEIAPLQYSLVSDDRGERAHGAEVVARALDIAAELGCRGVLTIPGYVGLPWVAGGGDVVSYADAYDRLVEELGRLVQRAEAAGVSIYIENIWNMFLMSPLELRRLIGDVNSTRLGVLLDIGNVTATGFAEQWIDILGPYLLEVHLKDYRRSVGTVDGFVPLLAGDVNWPAVMEALVRNGFGGYLIPETFPYAHFGSVSLAHTKAALDALLDHADGLRS